MTTKQELHQAIEELNEEEVQKVIQAVEIIRSDSREHYSVDPMRYSGVLTLTEDPLTYQQRRRDEWP